MPLVVPDILASPEGVRAGLVAAFDSADLQAAIDAVALAYPSPAITLALPVTVSTKEIGSYNEIGSAYPYVSVISGELRVVEAGEVLGSAAWEFDLFVDAFLQMDDPALLSTALYRYAVALWIVVLSHDPLAGAFVQYDGMSIEPDPSGGTANSRAVRLAMKYRFHT